jgi:predicted RNA-binding Zn ribbon-like protein
MDLLERVLGGPKQQTEYRDFIDRFDRGSPYDSIDDKEAVDRYERVAPELSRDEYRQSAEETFARLSPAERAEFSRWLRTRAQQRGVSVPDYDLNDDGIDDRMQDDPGQLAEMTTQLRDRDPNILEQLMGRGGTGGPLDNPIAKVAFAGIAAMAAQRLMGGRR